MRRIARRLAALISRRLAALIARRPAALSTPARLAALSTPTRLVTLTAVAVLAAGCAGTGAAAGSDPGQVRVVAAENFWGSIARQLGGWHAGVQSIIVNPAQDPHSYEPTTADARTMATAQLAIVNGVGYDPWAQKLLAANPVDRRLTLTVGSLFGLKDGDNPHRWYDPTEITDTAQAIEHDLAELDPRNADYFRDRLARFDATGLAEYHRLIAQIKARYAGVPVGASESIFALQAPALGLDLITPPSFMQAISEGTDVTAQDIETTQRQITDHAIKVWVYNSQNVTPGVQRLNAMARAAKIPIATVTETLSPASDSFQQWQVAQLRGIAAALHQATGR